MASRNRTFIRDELLPSYFMNVLQDRVGPLSSLRLRQASATTVEVPAAAGDGAAVLSIDGRWRWRETATSVAHPGGAPGTYLVFAVAAENDIVGTPLPNTDNTDYSFSLRVVADGNTPSLVPGVVDVVRRIGRVEWDGAAITAVVQEVGAVEASALAEGSVAASKLAASLASVLGVSQGATPRRGYAEALAEVTTASIAPVSLSGGPSVPVEVPARGLVLATWSAEGSTTPNGSQSTAAFFRVFRGAVDTGKGAVSRSGSVRGSRRSWRSRSRAW